MTVARTDAPVFDPPKLPSYPYRMELVPRGVAHRDHHGIDQVVAGSIAYTRRARLVWEFAPYTMRDYFESFLASLGGTRGPITWTPIDPVASPAGFVPTVVDEVRGANPIRAYKVKIAWYDPDSGETLPGAEYDAGDVSGALRVELGAPFPPGVEAWRVYVSKDAGPFYRQSTVIQSRVWLEPDDSEASFQEVDQPATSNTCTPAAKWIIDGDPVVERVANSTKWNLEISLLEQTA